MISRRRLLCAIPVAAGLAVFASRMSWASMTQAPAYEALQIKLPKNACDCHVHVFDPDRFPYAESRTYTPDKSPVPFLEQHLSRLGMDRVVIVQPSPYGTDNRCLLDALNRMGKQRARGVAVIGQNVTDQALQDMHAAGVRGVRLNLEVKGNADIAQVQQALQSIAKRVQPLDWHIQMYANLDTVKALADTVRNLPVKVVFDHYGHLDAAQGLDQPGYEEMLSLLSEGHVYVKLSALYRVSQKTDYSDVAQYAQSLVSHRADRLLWASDFPHTMPAPGTTRSKDKIELFRREDDGRALNHVAAWIKDPKTLHQILVDNPDRLYWQA
ncbi:4-sulfomuconolactone hydrolase [compost metagenome]